MSIANKSRFSKTNLKVSVGSVDIFPPNRFNYTDTELNLDLSLFCLGESNKDDLMPVNINTAELQRVLTQGDIKQIICTSDNGDLYDVCIYVNELKQCYIYGIRTRQLKK